MLCRVLMERLPPHVETIYLATPSLGRDEILHAIADDLDLKLSGERPTVALRELQEHLIRLYAAGRRVVVLIDEAHVMPDETLEHVRLLSNLESSRHKLLQIVLFGQPELDETLAKTSLRQLRDRITHGFRMRPLAPGEVSGYVSFRMRAAGYRGPDVFTPKALSLLARASDGLTRRINILSDKALLAAFTESTHAVTDRHVRAAIADSEFAAASRQRKLKRPGIYIGAALAGGLILGAAIPWWFSHREPSSFVPAQASPAVPAIQPRPAIDPQATPPAPPVATRPDAPPAASSVQPAVQLTGEQERQLAGYSAGGQRRLAERLAATRARLASAPDERYALELFITENSNAARMERFLVRASELVPLEEVFVIPMSAGGQYRLRVAFGEFETREAALQAGRRLPPKYQQAFRITARSFAELRGQI
jgi:type II secretory pathway predicted ATPase ExeA